MERSHITTREVEGRGVCAFAAKSFSAGEIVLLERALVVSALGAPGKLNRDLWFALAQLERTNQVPAFEPNQHIGAFAALRDLGPAVCRAKLLTKTVGDELALPSAAEARRDARVLRQIVSNGTLGQSAGSFTPGEYARLRQVMKVNGFRFNAALGKDDLGYDMGEVVFDRVSRINHSCEPNVTFHVSWSEEYNTMINSIVAARDMELGEEVCISYLPLSMPAVQRRRDFQRHWGFTCDCLSCRRDSAESVMPVASRAVQAVENVKSIIMAEDDMNSSASSDVGVCWEDLHDPTVVG